MKRPLAGALALLASVAVFAAPATGPLHGVTIASNALEESRLFYVDGLGLRLEGPLEVSPAVREAQRRLWRAPAGLEWREYALLRDGADYAARIRLLLLERATPAGRGSWDPRVLGPMTIGFPNTRQPELDARMRALGFGALNALERSPFVSDAGRRYEIFETVHTGPDFVSAVGVARGAGEPPITPVNGEGLGGPGYAMSIVADVDAMSRFMTEVVGWRVKSRRLWTSTGTRGAMNVPDGTQFEFAQLAPPGVDHGFLLFIEFRNLATRAPLAPPRLPARGIVLYSLPVADLDALLRRARAAGHTDIVGPLEVPVAGAGTRRAASVVAPNGVVFEFFE